MMRGERLASEVEVHSCILLPLLGCAWAFHWALGRHRSCGIHTYSKQIRSGL